MKLDNQCFATVRRYLRRLTYTPSTDMVGTSDSLQVYWWDKRKNLGDVLNKQLLELIGGSQVCWVPNNYSYEHFLATGSILGRANEHSVIWGSGLISKNDLPIFTPKKIHAVRGPLTRAVLLTKGIDCPQVYGDPALLLPMYFKSSSAKRYAIGVIPHYVDKQPWITNIENDDILFIDIETDDVQGFIDSVLSCDIILSSSLHGIIIADAYGIPAYHVNFGGKLIGGNFKFDDYYQSVHRKPVNVIPLGREKDLLSASRLSRDVDFSFDATPLLQACPFLE
jgi:pyruvyltransferase|tara:strand:- start:1356 stop:2198 length:843 start_codon:yes stop_codon:yes gene_type:complete